MSCFCVLTCITLLSGIYPLPAMHSLLVTSDARNILSDQTIRFKFACKAKSNDTLVVLQYSLNCTSLLMLKAKDNLWFPLS